MIDATEEFTEPRAQTIARGVCLLKVALCLAVCGHIATACRINEGKDPDQAPERGFNPVESSSTPEAAQNQLEPLDPRFEKRCEANLQHEQLEAGGVAFLEVKLTETPAEGTSAEVTIRDPRRLDYARDWMQILEPGTYTVQVTTEEGKGCWAGVEIASDEMSYTLVVAYPE